MQRWRDEKDGVAPTEMLGARPMEKSGTHYKPSEKDIQAACSYGGKVDERAAEALRSGSFSRVTTRMVAKGVARQWQAKTRDAKDRYVRKFFAFLNATGRRRRLFAEVEEEKDGEVLTIRPERRLATSQGEEEQTLCEFAVLRIMAGNTLDSVLGVVSHIRTWCRTILVREYGHVGTRGKLSMTSQYVKSLEEIFPPDLQQRDASRKPLTWGMVKMIHEYAKEEARWHDPGVAVAMAYAGLFRMGEMTCTETRAFDAVKDLCENDVEFLPSFWNANRVVIYLGVSKADRQGKRSKLRPRILPVEEGSPGMMLRDMLARRLRATRGTRPVLRGVPLLQARNGKQLARDTVLRFMRAAMANAGWSKEEQMEYGTHSARIGGATRLFKLGASPEALKTMGGWSSDAFKTYIRLQQQELMVYTRQMCQEE